MLRHEKNVIYSELVNNPFKYPGRFVKLLNQATFSIIMDNANVIMHAGKIEPSSGLKHFQYLVKEAEVYFII